MFVYIFYHYAAQQMSGALCCMCLQADQSGRRRNGEFWKFACVCSTYLSWVQPFSTLGVTGWGRTCALLSLCCHLACAILDDLLFATFSLLFHNCSPVLQGQVSFLGAVHPQQHGQSPEGREGLLHPCSGVWCPTAAVGEKSGRLGEGRATLPRGGRCVEYPCSTLTSSSASLCT